MEGLIRMENNLGIVESETVNAPEEESQGKESELKKNAEEIARVKALPDAVIPLDDILEQTPKNTSHLDTNIFKRITPESDDKPLIDPKKLKR